MVSSRDFTNFIKIGTERFEIQRDKKKKKMVVLPFQKLKRAISRVDIYNLQDFKGLRGKVVFSGYEILSGMSLKRIFSIVRKVQGTDRIIEKWPRGIHFEYLKDVFEIVRFIPHLLHLCKKTLNSRNLGFLTLITDGNGAYWYSGYRDYIQALEESVSSIESLIDEDINILTRDQEKIVNESYRRLIENLGE